MKHCIKGNWHPNSHSSVLSLGMLFPRREKKMYSKFVLKFDCLSSNLHKNNWFVYIMGLDMIIINYNLHTVIMIHYLIDKF